MFKSFTVVGLFIFGIVVGIGVNGPAPSKVATANEAGNSKGLLDKLSELEAKVMQLENVIKSNRKEIYKDVGTILTKKDVNFGNQRDDLFKHTQRAKSVGYLAGFPTGEFGDGNNTITVMMMPESLSQKCQAVATTE